MTHIVTLELPTPIGPMAIVLGPRAKLRAIGFATDHPRIHALLAHQDTRPPTDAEATEIALFSRALQAYFDGNMGAFDHLELDIDGTPFQRAVWQALRGIPSGQTCSYQELAKQIGRPSACRAVGAANRQNPLAIIIPCHRVIGTNGQLTGYGGGLHRKRWLLDHERKHTVAATTASLHPSSQPQEQPS